MKTFFLLVYSLALLLATSSMASAQTAPKITLSPESPEPRSRVVLRLTGYGFDLNTALIEWKVNGEAVLRGIGERELNVTTGDVGESQIVTVRAESETGAHVEQKITVTPASVVLIHEAPNSYVPFFYEGRSFASTAGLVRVTALPSLSSQGSPLAPETLSYTWYVDGDPNQKLSGRGKQSADIRLNYLKNKTDVKVVIRTPLGDSVSKTISLYPRDIEPRLYRYDEILGTLLTTQITKRLETTTTAVLSLEPYFISSKEDKPSSYKWLLDGFDVTPIGGQVLALVPKENSYGVKYLTIKLFGPDKRLQSAESNLEILFDTRK